MTELKSPFKDGDYVVCETTLTHGSMTVLQAGNVAQVLMCGCFWLKLDGLPGLYDVGRFRIATAEEAEVYMLMPKLTVHRPQDRAAPLRPYLLYTDPFPIASDLVATFAPSTDLIQLQAENRNLTTWLKDERQVVMDLRRQLAQVQDNYAELVGALTASRDPESNHIGDLLTAIRHK